ncbi:MAG: carbon starvation protein A [Spirochaetales bacterium]
MNALILLIVGIVLFAIAYVTYGSMLAKKWGINPARKTPAHELRNDSDYVPTDAKVVLGHHFSSIAGAGPITGPIAAVMFGWLPVYLWILVGSIFFGGVHDYGSLIASMRHEGKTIGEIIRANIGQKAKIIFSLYAFLTICLVVAAFLDITASTFAFDASDVANSMTAASSSTASMLFIAVALLFGIFYRRNSSLILGTAVGVALLVGIIAFSSFVPFLQLPKLAWQIILTVYIIAASLLPVWLLLQPRDYLSSFLLFAMIIGGFLGILFSAPEVSVPAFVGFNINGSYLFPILFVTVACGAISGFHSLVSSGTSSKQIDNEKDAKLVGYGGMLIEGVVAIIALLSVSAIVGNTDGTPAVRFANGVATFMNSFGIPIAAGKIFVTLTYASFALTSLDSATRIGRYLLEELGEYTKKDGTVVKTILCNPYVATLLTVGVSLLFTLYGYARIWPIFGSANQLLAGLALLAIAAWIKNTMKRTSWETIIPLIFMFAVTFSALVIIVISNFKLGTFDGYVLGTIAIGLVVLAVLELITVATNSKKIGTPKK